MKDEHSPKKLAQDRKLTLEERLSNSPLVHKRIVQIVGVMEKALAEGYTADEAEEMAIEQVDKLGNDILSDWAVNQEKSSFEKAKRSHPNAIADGKKTPVDHDIRRSLSRRKNPAIRSTRKAAKTL